MKQTQIRSSDNTETIGTPETMAETIEEELNYLRLLAGRHKGELAELCYGYVYILSKKAAQSKRIDTLLSRSLDFASPTVSIKLNRLAEAKRDTLKTLLKDLKMFF